MKTGGSSFENFSRLEHVCRSRNSFLRLRGTKSDARKCFEVGTQVLKIFEVHVDLFCKGRGSKPTFPGRRYVAQYLKELLLIFRRFTTSVRDRYVNRRSRSKVLVPRLRTS